jgi:peptidoglycan/xylan/chitin deacetylase (PgdA/CDA1 family)
MLLYVFLGLMIGVVGIGLFCVFFDQAILTRKDTIYRFPTKQKKVALTFDDGPSPQWTPKILDELNKAGIKATFFLVGSHVQKYPEVARRIVKEGHTIGNHGYAHSVLFYYTPAEIEEEIKYSEQVIKDITGYTTKFFRPPKAWLRKTIKQKIKSMGYAIILWSLNSKDWVSFNHKNIVRYIARKVKNGDILLFHDSGNVFSKEGGVRTQTVKSITLLARTLKQMGYKFVSIEELLNE